MSFLQMVGKEEKGVILMGSSSRKRQRFHIELKSDETTIISWKKLLRDAEKKHSCGSHLHSSSNPRRALDDKAYAGKCNDSSFRSGRYKSRVTSSKNEQLSKTKAEMTKIEGDFVDNLTAKHEITREGMTTIKYSNSSAVTGKFMAEMTKFKRKNLDDHFADRKVKSENFMNIASETVFPLNKASSHTSTSAMVSDRQLQELHDVPVLVYSKKSASCGNTSKCPPVLNVQGGASVFPLKAKDILQQMTGKFSLVKTRIKTEFGSDSHDVTHQNSESRCLASSMNFQSMNLIKGKKTEVQSVVRNDHLVRPTGEAKITRNAGAVPNPMSRVIDPGILANSSHPPVKRVKFNFPTKRNMITTGTQSHPKEQKIEIPEKKNVKVRFLLKQEHAQQTSKEQGAKKTLKNPRLAAS